MANLTTQQALSALDPQTQLGIMEQKRRQRKDVTSAVQVNREHKLNQAKFQLNKKLQEKKLQLLERETAAAEAKNAREAAKFRQEAKLTDAMMNRDIQTNAGRMNLGVAAFSAKKGAPIKAIGEPELLETMENPETGEVKALVSNPGGDKPFKIIPMKDLKGFRESATRETEIHMGPRGKASEREVGKEIGQVRDPEWLNKRREEFFASNTRLGPAILNPGTPQYSEALSAFRQKVKEDLDNIYTEDDIIMADGPSGKGYYRLKSDNSTEFIRSLPE